jgi:hypothetical protein
MLRGGGGGGGEGAAFPDGRVELVGWIWSTELLDRVAQVVLNDVDMLLLLC